MTLRGIAAVATLTLLASGCRGSLSPLSNRIEVGQEPFFVFVAEGEEGVGDLWAAKPAGGTPYRITFTRPDERLPALAPDGSMLAFVRARAPGDTAAGSLVVMNLLNGAERRVELAGNPVDALAWSADGRAIYARRGEGILVLAAPPARGELTPVSPGNAPAADSAFRVLLGDPPIGEAVPCEDAPGICAVLATGEVTPLSPIAADPIRWPGDSVAYREGEEWVIRPLGGGATRTIRWASPVAHVRSLSAVGAPPRAGPPGSMR